MVDVYGQAVVATPQGFCHVERPHRTPHQFTGVGGAVEGHGSVCSHALKLQEIAASRLLLGSEHLIIYSRTMQVAMTQLPVAIIVVEVMG